MDHCVLEGDNKEGKMYPWAKVPVSIVFGPFLSCKGRHPYQVLRIRTIVAYVLLNVFSTIHISITYEKQSEECSCKTG